MQKWALAALTGVATFAMMNTADAEERWPRWYVGLNAGLAIHEDSDLSTGGTFSFEDSAMFGATLGYKPHFGNSVLNMTRYELEVVRFGNDVDTFSGVSALGDLTTLAYMFNSYIDFDNSTAFTPYIGGGIGSADVELGTGTGSQSDQVLAYQAMAGVGYSPELIPMTEWTLGYRYFSTTDPEYSFGDIENTTHNLEAGVKLRF